MHPENKLRMGLILLVVVIGSFMFAIQGCITSRAPARYNSKTLEEYATRNKEVDTTVVGSVPDNNYNNIPEDEK